MTVVGPTHSTRCFSYSDIISQCREVPSRWEPRQANPSGKPRSGGCQRRTSRRWRLLGHTPTQWCRWMTMWQSWCVWPIMSSSIVTAFTRRLDHLLPCPFALDTAKGAKNYIFLCELMFLHGSVQMLCEYTRLVALSTCCDVLGCTLRATLSVTRGLPRCSQSCDSIRRQKQLVLDGGTGLGISFETDSPQYSFGVRMSQTPSSQARVSCSFVICVM